MALKIGSSDVSFRLGNATPDAVYLGQAQVFAATPVAIPVFYWHDGADLTNTVYYWSQVEGWYMDEARTVPATTIPTPGSDVVIGDVLPGSLVRMDENNDFVETNIRNLSVVDNGAGIFLTVTVTGVATFTGGYNYSFITGNAVFVNHQHGGFVTGDAVFDNSAMEGGVTGTATFVNGGCFNLGDWQNNTGLETPETTFVPDPPPAC
jgi:hypothetical protein